MFIVIDLGCLITFVCGIIMIDSCFCVNLLLVFVFTYIMVMFVVV